MWFKAQGTGGADLTGVQYYLFIVENTSTDLFGEDRLSPARFTMY